MKNWLNVKGNEANVLLQFHTNYLQQVQFTLVFHAAEEHNTVQLHIEDPKFLF